MNELTPKPDFILYTSQDGDVKFEVFLQDETIWLTQKMMAELFGVDVRTVSEHLQNIFKTAELQEDSAIRKIRTTASDGKAYDTQFYDLDAIISVGYRVNSARATQFRIWATQRLREFIVKGFVIDDERLKNPDLPFDYFEELTRQIQEIISESIRQVQMLQV